MDSPFTLDPATCDSPALVVLFFHILYTYCMGLKQTAKAKGMGGFLQVTRLKEEQPDINEFFAIVTAVKAPPPGVENASLIIVLDETPLADCNEIALNQTNTNRVIKFLDREFGTDEDTLLIDCVIYLRVKEYKGFLAAGMSQYGLEIFRIEPPEGHETARPMTFEQSKPQEPVTVAEDPAAKARAERRAKLMQQQQQKEKPESETIKALKGAAKKRK